MILDKPVSESFNNDDNKSLSSKPYLYSIGFLFLAVMHYYQPNGGGQGLSLAFNNTVWIAISVIIAVGLWRMSTSKRIVYTTFDLAALALIVVLALPLLWAESPWREATYDRYLAIVGFWLIILTHRQFQLNEKEQQYYWLIISGGVLAQCIIGLVQYAHSGQWMIIPGGRPSGAFQQVNVYASFLATGLAISIYQLVQYKQARWFIAAHMLIIFLVGVLQWLVFSRTGMLGCILVLVGLSLLYRQQKAALVKILMVFTLGVLSGLGLQQLSGTEGRSIESAQTAGYRTTLYSLSWELIKEKPLLGHGLGKFQTVFLEKQAEAYAEGKIASTYGSRAYSHPHNEILFWWVEAGLLPVLVFLVLALAVIMLMIRHKSLNRIGIVIILIPILLHTQTEYPLYHSSLHLCLLALLLAALTNVSKASVVLNFNRLPAILSVLTVALVLIFMLTNLHSTYLLATYASKKKNNYLTSIINPFGQPKLINRLRSVELISIGTTDSLKLAEIILLEEITLRPDEPAYLFLYDAYIFAGDVKAADLLLNKVQRLFPEPTYFTE